MNMWSIKKSISETQLFELRDHRDNTSWELIKVYTASQLSYMDGVAEDTIKRNAKKYLPVRVDSWPAMDRYRHGQQKKPYRIMYIRLDEIRALYHKRTGNTLAIELK
jgi:hypothetical protein